MKITKKRIVNVKKHLSDINKDDLFYLGIRNNSIVSNLIKKDFDIIDSEHSEFMPKPYLGKYSQRNSVGETIPDKSLNKIKAYRAQSYELVDWGGYSHSGTTYVSYKKYPSKFIEPNGFSFRKINDCDNNELIIIDYKFVNSEEYYNKIKFCINLILEIFSEVETFDIDDISGNIKPVKKILPWEILPKGEKIWNVFKDRINNYNISKSEKLLIEDRFDYIESFKPDYEYQGKAGYSGYIVFCFKDMGLYIIDSVIYGNATYVFSDSWEDVSKLSKKEIIDGDLCKSRIIHSKSWKKQIENELKSSK